MVLSFSVVVALIKGLELYEIRPITVHTCGDFIDCYMSRLSECRACLRWHWISVVILSHVESSDW
jgi:hypothetical protein